LLGGWDKIVLWRTKHKNEELQKDLDDMKAQYDDMLTNYLANSKEYEQMISDFEKVVATATIATIAIGSDTQLTAQISTKNDLVPTVTSQAYSDKECTQTRNDLPQLRTNGDNCTKITIEGAYSSTNQIVFRSIEITYPSEEVGKNLQEVDMWYYQVDGSTSSTTTSLPSAYVENEIEIQKLVDSKNKLLILDVSEAGAFSFRLGNTTDPKWPQKLPEKIDTNDLEKHLTSQQEELHDKIEQLKSKFPG